jgi:homoserine dehydrogenase
VVNGKQGAARGAREGDLRRRLRAQGSGVFRGGRGGGIPIIKAISEGFVANHIQSIHGIINGTSNYILTRMTESGMGFKAALAEAQAAGYAEADPALDVNGGDAAHKAIILASLAYGFWVPAGSIFVEGIEKVTAGDIQFAGKLGYTIKLLAHIKAAASGAIEVRVHPTLVPKSHVLASVNGVFNAIAVRGDVVGETLFYGRGAGQDATSSAVIADIAGSGGRTGLAPAQSRLSCRTDSTAPASRWATSSRNFISAFPSRIALASSRRSQAFSAN